MTRERTFCHDSRQRSLDLPGDRTPVPDAAAGRSRTWRNAAPSVEPAESSFPGCWGKGSVDGDSLICSAAQSRNSGNSGKCRCEVCDGEGSVWSGRGGSLPWLVRQRCSPERDHVGRPARSAAVQPAGCVPEEEAPLPRSRSHFNWGRSTCDRLGRVGHRGSRRRGPPELQAGRLRPGPWWWSSRPWRSRWPS